MNQDNQRKRMVRPVEEDFDFGIYVWQFNDGTYLSDGDGNYLNIAGRKFDLEKMAALNSAVKYYGVDTETGKVVFLPGVTRATDSEYEEDQERFRSGLTPYGDFGAYKDGNKNRRQ